MSFLRSPARRCVLRVTGALIALLLVAAASPAYTFTARAGSGQKVSGQAVSGKPPAGLQRAADQMVADGAPGVIIVSRLGHHVSHVVAGLADQATGQPMQVQDRVHIGSITKTFVATVALQLAAERRLSLDDSVQKLLPGVITGHGYHPARITIRQLLQHTSGSAITWTTRSSRRCRAWQRRGGRSSSSTSRCGSGRRCTAGCTRTPTTSCSA